MSQIKPLTEEEKKAKLQELREKLAAKRAVQSKEEEKANKANEALRRKAGQASSGPTLVWIASVGLIWCRIKQRLKRIWRQRKSQKKPIGREEKN